MKLPFLQVAFALCLLSFTPLSAQTPAKVTIKGSVLDSTGTTLPFATVMLLNPTDTTLVNYTRSDENGAFAFKSVRNVPYLLKISYIGYIPFQKRLEASASEINDVGALAIEPINAVLMEVVIREAKAPLTIRGDTIEYDATTFKVPPGSTVEDLLRRLPGIEVDADGNIKAQGKDVKRVFVDGKTFFGDDPKSATQNLGAETISKVQVYDGKSEQAELTGVDDGAQIKTMNLELKEEYKKGAFGKVTAAVGTEERWATRGNYNRFNEKQQFSVIGYANNINQTGVNWDDYREFKGQNAFNDYDNGDFGFSSGGGRIFYFSSEDSPINNFDGRGFTKNAGAGVNYNFDNKKTQYNASYFYNQSDLTLDEYGWRQTFLSDNSFFNTDTLHQNSFRGSHSFATRLEQQIDSSDVLIAKVNFRFSTSDVENRQSQLFSGENGDPSNQLQLNNANDLNSLRITSAAIFRHRFKKKGRSFAVSAGYNDSRSDGTENLFSLNEFFQAPDFTAQVRQLNNKNNNTRQIKSSLLYTDAISKKWFWETFYNFNQTQNQVNRQVQDPDNNFQRVDPLSVYYRNTVQYNRFGADIRYSFEGLNMSAGVAAQNLNLYGEYSIDEGEPLLTDPIQRSFLNWTPNANVNYQITNNIYASTGYSYNINEPRFEDLQPVPNVSNPAFRMEGNPDLTPERSHEVNFNLNYWNPANFGNIGIGSNYSVYDNQIVYSQVIEQIDSIGIRTTTRPENTNGGNRYSAYMWSSYPIIKTKLSANAGGNLYGGKAPAFVNNVANETQNLGFNLNFGLSITPNNRLVLDVEGNLDFNDISYSIQSEQNQKIRNYSTNLVVKWQFADKFFFDTYFNYAIYRNDRYDFKRDVPLWNASVRRLLGKENKLELRLSASDLLNQRVNIDQFGTQNYVATREANTLARYFMLSLSYNVRGYENKIKKNNYY